MKKEKDILIRVESEVKREATTKAKSLGLSLSAYVRTLIVQDLKK